MQQPSQVVREIIPSHEASVEVPDSLSASMTADICKLRLNHRLERAV